MQESGIFKEAVKLPSHERAAYLDRVCGVNAALRLEVEALLRAHEQPGDFLHRPPIADAPTYLGAGPERPGMRVGPYKLLQFLGEGGMGTVFLAEQTKPVRRMVALKIIKPGMDSSHILARFEAERQALALMDHPNIAKVLDAGAIGELKTEDLPAKPSEQKTDQTSAYVGNGTPANAGRPYFVMELVKGVPITEFCDKNRLSTRQRLELFIPVCQAIQHAHMKGIIHRDIKPSNVLIALYDGKPVPKVIDFGVAKAMSEPLTQRTLFTQVGQVVGTIEYMSPEQATLNQLDIDTRSDIYSLGVLLYELLTGMTPLNRERLKTLAFDQMLRTIREEEPMRPSARLTSELGALATAASYRGVESGKLAGLLRGELDWIVMKCLEKERDRRFITAGSLAQDIERYLNDEPVTACPPSLGYRMRKTYRKNKALITTAGIVAAVLVVGIITSTWQAIRATDAQQDAQTKQMIAEKAQKDLEVQKDELETERDNLKAAREKIRQSHYASSMNFIHAAWEANNVPRVLELLEDNRPRPGEPDLRGFEWHYWDRLCHAERRKWVFDSSSDMVNSQLSGDARRLFCTRVTASSPSEEEAVISVLDPAMEREIFKVKVGMVDASVVRGNFGGVSVSISHDGSRFACRLVNAMRSGGFNGPVSPVPNVSVNYPTRVYDVGRDEPIFNKVLGNNNRLALSPDGKWLATVDPVANSGESPFGTRWKSIRIWDLSQPDREPVIIPGDTKERTISFLSFSPDGSRLLGMGGDRAVPSAKMTLQIWDRATGQEKIHHPISSNRQAFAAYSADGKRLAVTSSSRGTRTGRETVFDSTITILDGADGDALTEASVVEVDKTNESTFNAPRAVFSPDGRRLALIGVYIPILIVDIATGAVIQTIKSTGVMSNGVFSADGTRLYTTGRDNLLSVLQGSTGGASNRRPNGDSAYREWDLVPYEKPAAPTAKQPRENRITVTSANGQRKLTFVSRSAPQDPDQRSSPPDTDVTIYDGNHQVISVFKKHTARVLRGVLSPDGRWACTTNSKEVFFWDAETAEVRWQGALSRVPFQFQDSVRLNLGVFSPDSRWFVRPDVDDYKLVSLPDLQERASLGPISSTVFSPDSRRLVTSLITGGKDPLAPTSKLMLWDLESGREIAIRDGSRRSGLASSVAFSPDSRFLVTGGFGAMVITNAATGEDVPIAANNGVSRNARFIFSPDSTRMLLLPMGNVTTLFGGGAASVIELTTGKTLCRLEGAGGQNVAAAFSPNGRRIATVSSTIITRKSDMKIWDASTGRELLSQAVSDVQPLFNFPGGLAFSPDGHRLTFTPIRATLNEFGEYLSPRGEVYTWDATPRPEPKQP